ncbi:MAG: hypothetical protein HZB70_02880 [Candidatus Berkelbacteria bacterium]|nr:MAG: hypothetical protein HZB70_02880 [Candidatus Berkelbacteria bacterium]QQG51750.1 MAG: hypothetical protein HY845_00115 [Candidatus Berkelbacteria bacterium]
MSNSFWVTFVFVILLIAAFAFGMSSIFKNLQAGEPVFNFNKTPATEVQDAPSQFQYPLLP